LRDGKTNLEALEEQAMLINSPLGEIFSTKLALQKTCHQAQKPVNIKGLRKFNANSIALNKYNFGKGIDLSNFVAPSLENMTHILFPLFHTVFDLAYRQVSPSQVPDHFQLNLMLHL
jgi:hypothetical protein